ncbi:MAG: plastocyanin/azurin family copper-binding protein [Solirubrobacterales bacterium]
MGSGGSSSARGRFRARVLGLIGAVSAVLLLAPAANLSAQGTGQAADTATTPAEPAPPGDVAQASEPGTPQPAGAEPRHGNSGGSAPPRVRTSRTAATAAGSSSVSIVGATASSFAFSPRTIVITAGDTVRWVNNSSTSQGHTATGKSFDSGFMKPGDRYSHTFKDPGSFSYICSIHPFMKGTVTVKSSGSGGSGGGNGGGSSGGGSGSGSTGGGSGGSDGSGGTAGGSGVGSSTGSSGAPSATGQLPSTGLALVPLAALGAALIVLGVAMATRLRAYW